MRVLYHLTLSPFARKVRLVLAEKNLDFTLKLEKVWERRAEFLALNPAGDVPVLIEPDGTVLAGTDAIVEYLDEVYREKNPKRKSTPLKSKHLKNTYAHLC